MTTKKSLTRAGFTLIEMLVVIGITTILSAIAITYSKTGQNEVALTVETSKIAELVLQAKDLAINTYGATASGAKACAFGVHFDVPDQTYSLFAFSPGLAQCPSAASTTINFPSSPTSSLSYEPGSTDISIAQGVSFTADFTDVLFYPPAPVTLVNTAGYGGYFQSTPLPAPAPAASHIYLSTVDGRNSATISINADGQVSF